MYSLVAVWDVLGKKTHSDDLPHVTAPMSRQGGDRRAGLERRDLIVPTSVVYLDVSISTVAKEGGRRRKREEREEKKGSGPFLKSMGLMMHMASRGPAAHTWQIQRHQKRFQGGPMGHDVARHSRSLRKLVAVSV